MQRSLSINYVNLNRVDQLGTQNFDFNNCLQCPDCLNYNELIYHIECGSDRMLAPHYYEDYGTKFELYCSFGPRKKYSNSNLSDKDIKHKDVKKT